MIRAAVIGLGRVGFEFSLEEGRGQLASHLSCYIEFLGRQNVAVCDTNIAQLSKVQLHYFIAEEDGNKLSYYQNYEEMLNRFKPHVVSICTPTNTHEKIACEVVSFPSVKSLFVEKPIAQSMSEANRIIEACKSHGVKLTVNHQRRWDPTYQFLAANLKDPKTIIGIHHGPILRTGIHMLDLFNWIVGKRPVSAQAFGKSFTNYVTDATAQPPFNDVNISGIITYEEGIEAILVSGPQKPFVLFEFDAIYDNGRLRVTENGDRVEVWDAFTSDRYAGLGELKPVSVRMRKEPSSLFEAIKEVCNFESFAAPNSCSGEEGKKALQLALALNYSAAHNNQIVPLDNGWADAWTVRSY